MKNAIVCFIGLVFVVSVSAESLLEGRVRLESGEPVADAQVRLFDMTDLRQGAIARAQTDGTGYFALPLAALGGRALPARFALGPNYPNPFNPSTIIPYQLAASSAVRLEVFNLLGQRIATLVDGELPVGFHTATWTATDAAGRAVGAGVYIYRMTVGAASQTGRMVLLDGQAGVAAGGSASVWSGVSDGGGSDGTGEQAYGLIVSGEGLVPYVDSAFRVEAGMAPVELVVSEGQHPAGKATDDGLGDLFDAFNEQQRGPDLVVDSPLVTGSSAFTPGGTFTLLVTVRNQGDSLATATTLRYYRSTDATISTRDTEVGTGAVDALAAAGTSAKFIRLTTPLSEGIYYYGACVTSVAGESNTNNNCSSSRAVRVWSESSPVTIPEAKLRAAIEVELGKASGATITKGEMSTLLRLDVNFAGISDLTGLEFATNLTWLQLVGNSITDISALSSLTNLDFLNLGGNQITDISALSSLTKLTWLILDGNQITDISALSGLTNLTGLFLTNNQITDISALSGLTKLPRLNLAANEITDISALSGLTRLTELWLYNNNISDVSALSGLTRLTELWLDDNNISDISALLGLTKLTELGLRLNLLNVSSNNHIAALKRSGVTVHLEPPFRESDFDIELVFLDDHFTEKQKRALRYAARRWMSIIRKDLPDYTFSQGWSGECGDHSYAIPSGERIDDLRIYITGFSEGDFLGWGGPRVLRETSSLPVLGCMGIYSIYLDTGLHEIGHVLGIGTIWNDLGFLRNPSRGGNKGADTFFNGPLAIAAFDAAGGSSYTGGKVPVRNDGEPRSADSHWRFSVFGDELMAAGTYVSSFDETHYKSNNALSAITIQSLADLGYVVDVTQADPYTLPSAAAKASAKIAAPSTHTHGEQREPMYVVDPQGRIVRTISP